MVELLGDEAMLPAIYFIFSRAACNDAVQQCLREGARLLQSWRLDGVTLYVTLEPCPMCAGAMVLARIDRLVYGAPDPKKGAVDSVYDVLRHPANNHRVQVSSGVLAEPAGQLLRDFFVARRTRP